MQDIIQLGIEDDVKEVLDGLSAGSKVKMVVEATVSEIDDERFVATIDNIHDDVEIMDEGEDYDPEENEEVEDTEDTEESEDEEIEVEEEDE